MTSELLSSVLICVYLWLNRIDAKSSRNPLQTMGISRSTSDRYRTSAGPLPKQHACNTGRAGNNKPGRAPRTPGKQKARAMKVKERGSERGGWTIALFTSFSGETVQAMVEPLFGL
jgi:hypothetical protein